MERLPSLCSHRTKGNNVARTHARQAGRHQCSGAGKKGSEREQTLRVCSTNKAAARATMWLCSIAVVLQQISILTEGPR